MPAGKGGHEESQNHRMVCTGRDAEKDCEMCIMKKRGQTEAGRWIENRCRGTYLGRSCGLWLPQLHSSTISNADTQNYIILVLLDISNEIIPSFIIAILYISADTHVN